GCVESVAKVNALAVTAEFNHLRTAVELLPRFAGVGCAADDTTDPEGAHFLRMERVTDVVLDEFACTPARDIQAAVINGEVDVGDKGGHRLEALQKRGQLGRIRGLGRNLDHLLNRP